MKPKPKPITKLVHGSRLLVFTGWKNTRPTSAGNFKC